MFNGAISILEHCLGAQLGKCWNFDGGNRQINRRLDTKQVDDDDGKELMVALSGTLDDRDEDMDPK